MLVLLRFRVETDEVTGFRERAEAALAVLGQRPGFVDGSLGRATDDPTLWVLALRWRHVGAYRRALGSYDVRVGVVPLLSTAIDEPTAYEVLEQGEPGARAEDADWSAR